MSDILIALFALLALLSGPALIVFIILYFSSHAEVKRLRKKVSELEKLNRGGNAVAAPVAVKTPAPQPQVEPAKARPVSAVEASLSKQTVAPVVPAAPVAPVAPKQKSKISTINITFGVGVLLLTIVGAFFIAVSWGFMNEAGRVAVLLGAVAMVFALSFLATKILKLSQTGFAFYCLGSFLLPVTICGIGAWGLLGDGFSFRETPGIVLAVASVAFGIIGLVGMYAFKSNFHIGISYFGFTWTALFVCLEAESPFKYIVLVISLIALISQILKKFIGKMRGFGLYSQIMTWASLISLFSAFNEEFEILYLLGIVFSAAAFEILGFTDNKAGKFLSPIVLSSIYILIAMNVEDLTKLCIFYLIFGVVAAVVYKAIKSSNIVSDLFFAVPLVFASLLAEEWYLSVPLILLAVAIILVGMLDKKYKVDSKVIGAIALVPIFPLVIPEVMSNFYDGVVVYSLIALAAGMTITIIHFILNRKRPAEFKVYTIFSVAVSIIAAIVSMVSLTGEEFSNYKLMAPSLVIALAFFFYGFDSIVHKREKGISNDSSKVNVMLVIWSALGFNMLAVPLDVYFTEVIVPENLPTVIVATWLGICIAGFIALRVLHLLGNVRASKYKHAIDIVLTVTTSAYVLFGAGSVNKIVMLIVLLVLIATEVFDGFSVATIIPVITLQAVLSDMISGIKSDDYMIRALLFFLVAIGLNVIGRVLNSKKIVSKNTFDWFSTTSIISIFFIMLTGYKHEMFLGFVALTMYLCNFIGRVPKKANKGFLTAAVITLMFAFQLQKFVEIHELINTEYHLIVFLLAMFALRMWVKPFGPGVMRVLWIISCALVIFVESISAAVTAEIFDLMVVGITAIGMFVYSFIRKEKSWFTLSIVTLCGIGVYLSVTFGGELVWLLYIFIAGVILIVFAALNEYGKRKAAQAAARGEKHRRFFDEWKW